MKYTFAFLLCMAILPKVKASSSACFDLFSQSALSRAGLIEMHLKAALHELPVAESIFRHEAGRNMAGELGAEGAALVAHLRELDISKVPAIGKASGNSRPFVKFRQLPILSELLAKPISQVKTYYREASASMKDWSAYLRIGVRHEDGTRSHIVVSREHSRSTGSVGKIIITVLIQAVPGPDFIYQRISDNTFQGVGRVDLQTDTKVVFADFAPSTTWEKRNTEIEINMAGRDSPFWPSYLQ